MTTTGRKSASTKRKIMQCFWELFEQKSIEKITVSEITSRLKINRSTFYAYFKDVYDVLDQIEDMFLPTPEQLQSYCLNLKDPEEFYQAFLELFDSTYAKMTFLLGEQGDPNFERKLKNWIRPAFRKKVPMEYQQHKFFDLSLEFVLSSMISVIVFWANHPSEITSRELFDHLHNMYVYGIPNSLGIPMDFSSHSVHNKPESIGYDS